MNTLIVILLITIAILAIAVLISSGKIVALKSIIANKDSVIAKRDVYLAITNARLARADEKLANKCHNLLIERDQLVLERDCLAEKALELWDKVKSNLWCDSSAALKAEAVGLCAKKLFSENLVSASTIEVVDLTDDAFAAKYGDVAWCKAAIEALRSYDKTLDESSNKSESTGTNIPLDGSMKLTVDEDKKATYRSTKVKQQPPMRSEDNK